MAPNIIQRPVYVKASWNFKCCSRQSENIKRICACEYSLSLMLLESDQTELRVDSLCAKQPQPIKTVASQVRRRAEADCPNRPGWR